MTRSCKADKSSHAEVLCSKFISLLPAGSPAPGELSSFLSCGICGILTVIEVKVVTSLSNRATLQGGEVREIYGCFASINCTS